MEEETLSTDYFTIEFLRHGGPKAGYFKGALPTSWRDTIKFNPSKTAEYAKTGEIKYTAEARDTFLLTPEDLEVEFSQEDYAKVSQEDDVYMDFSGDKEFIYKVFKVKAPSNVRGIKATWSGKVSKKWALLNIFTLGSEYGENVFPEKDEKEIVVLEKIGDLVDEEGYVWVGLECWLYPTF